VTAMLTPTRIEDLPPGVKDWTPEPHVIERAHQRGFALLEVLMTAAEPEMVVPNPQRDDSMFHIRGDCQVVVNPAQRVIITVMPSKYSTPETLARRQAKAEQWLRDCEPIQADQEQPAGGAPVSPAKARAREREHHALLDRVNRGTPKTPSQLEVPGRGVAEHVLRQLRDSVVQQIKDRPGYWATLDCDVRGLPTLLSATDGVELKCYDGMIRVRWNAADQ
jgi:hypothetical protein